MHKLDQEEILNLVDREGFDYTFRHYTSFEDIEDETFHKLRKNYKEAARQLEEYIEKKID